MKKIITLIFILISFGMNAQLKTVSDFKKDFEKIVESDLTKEQLDGLFQEYELIFTVSDAHSYYGSQEINDSIKYSMLNFKYDSLYTSNIEKLLNSKNQYNRALAYLLIGATNDKSKEEILLDVMKKEEEKAEKEEEKDTGVETEKEEEGLDLMVLLSTLRQFAEQSHYADQKSEREELNKQTSEINIEWTNNLDGDFSFKDRWQYEETTLAAIIKKEGLMVTGSGDEEELCKKWESKEKELDYNTTHYPYTLQTSGQSDQLDYILAEQIDPNTVECQSSGKTIVDGVGDAWLNLNIVENECYPIIGYTKYNIHQFLQSPDIRESNVPAPFETIYPCTEGNITIDKTSWDGGWLKASFSLIFNSSESGNFTLSGKIFTPIQNKELKGEPLIKYDEGQYNYRLSLSSKYE